MARFRCRLRTVLLMALIMGSPWFQVALADLNDGLVAYYPFNGNANDESGNGNHGTVIGATLVADKFGKKNQAYNFPESNDYIEIGDVEALDGIPQLTGIAWIKPSSLPANATLIGKRHSCGHLFGGFVMRLSNSELTFLIFDSSDTRLVVETTSSPMSIDSWQHVAFVFDGSEADVADKMRLYYNGMKQPASFLMNYPHIQTGSSKSALRIATTIDVVCAHEDFNGKMDDIRLYNRALSEGEVQALYQQGNAAACQLYAVQDTGLNDSQFFTVDPVTFEVKALGDMKKAHDIEALDTHPQTTELFAASGKDTKKPGYLYSVDKNDGKLTDIGPTGFKEIDGLSFHPDGTLWGWASGDGLVTIDNTGQAKLVAAYPGEVEDLTWNTAGTILFAVENLRNNPDTGVKLLAYDGNTLKTVCEETTQLLEIEALDTLPDDTLIFGLHGKTSLPLGAIDVTTCQIIAEKEIATNYNDVEGIAWPEKACAPQVARSCQEIKENAPSSEDGIYLIDPDGKGGNEPFEVYCDMTTDDGGFTFAIGNTVINSFDSIKEGCPKGLSPFQLSSNSHGIALHNYVANQLEENTRYWANVFAGPHKHTSDPGHRDNEYGYLDNSGEWHNAGIDESQSPYHDIPNNWNLNIFDPIPLVGGTGYYADVAQTALYNSTEQVIEGYAICSTNDK
jgi:hypothetical protein